MRWFVIFLLLANIALYFWVQQQSRPANVPDALTAPDVGHLRLLRDELTTGMDATSQAPQSEQTPDLAEDAATLPTLPASAPDAAAAYKAQPAEPESRPVISAPQPVPVEAGLPVPVREDDAVADTEPLPAEMPDPQAAISSVAKTADETNISAEEPVSFAAPAATEAAADLDRPGRPAAQEAAAPAAIDDDAVDDARPALVCEKLGPLDNDQADALIAGLPEGARVLDDVRESYRKADGYYVMIPALPSLAEGRRMLQRLNDAGITDTWLFRSGDNRNAISLGLFSRQSGAERHAANIAGKGFSPEVRERIREFDGRFLVIGSNAAAPSGVGIDPPEPVGSVLVDCPKP